MRIYYASVDTQPIIYWVFDSAILGDAWLEYSPSESGDVCHINIKNLTNQQAEEIFIHNFVHEECRICLNDLDKPFTREIFK